MNTVKIYSWVAGQNTPIHDIPDEFYNKQDQEQSAKRFVTWLKQDNELLERCTTPLSVWEFYQDFLFSELFPE